MTIHLSNYAKPTETKGKYPYYKWEVFVDETDDILDQIDSVEYLLHPTFPKPYQARDDRKTKFSLQTAGWGEFDITATIIFKDGLKEITKYRLDLSKRWPDSE